MGIKNSNNIKIINKKEGKSDFVENQDNLLNIPKDFSFTNPFTVRGFLRSLKQTQKEILPFKLPETELFFVWSSWLTNPRL